MISLWTRYTNYILFYFLRYVPSGRVGGVMDNGLLRSNWQLIFKKYISHSVVNWSKQSLIGFNATKMKLLFFNRLREPLLRLGE